MKVSRSIIKRKKLEAYTTLKKQEQFLVFVGALEKLPFTLAHIDVKIEDHTSDFYYVLRDPVDSVAPGRYSIFMMLYILFLGSYSIFVRWNSISWQA